MTVYRSAKAGNYRDQENRYFYYDSEPQFHGPITEQNDCGCEQNNCGCEHHNCGCEHHDCECKHHDCGGDTCKYETTGPQYDYDHDHNHNHNQNYNENDNATVVQDADQYSFMDQESAELIWVKESCNIVVNTTDTQVGVTLQAALQLAIALVIRITIGDSDRSDAVTQELVQYSNIDQVNKQKIYIYNSKDATVTTTDTDLAINIQVLLQVLIAVIVLIDIL